MRCCMSAVNQPLIMPLLPSIIIIIQANKDNDDAAAQVIEEGLKEKLEEFQGKLAHRMQSEKERNMALKYRKVR